MNVQYEVVRAEELTSSIKRVFAEMLKKQGKVMGNLDAKADRCKMIALAKVNGHVVAIGAIKPKTRSVFSLDKAAVPSMEKKFEWELGYLFTLKEYAGQGIAKKLSNILVEEAGSKNLMASTELSENPRMVKILEEMGFRKYGTSWKSQIHGHDLALFLRWSPEAKSEENFFSASRE